MDWQRLLQSFYRRRDFYRAVRRFRNLPAIRVMLAQANFYKPNTSPNPDWIVEIFSEAGELVGSATYGVTPLNDQLWLYQIEIAPEFQRKGYALAFLRYLNHSHNLAVTPVHELWSAAPFWATARMLNNRGLRIDCSLSDTEMVTSRERWKHLLPIQRELLDTIHTRLASGENWFHAIGRGLDE